VPDIWLAFLSIKDLGSNLKAADNYRPDIDGLRAIAVMMVLVFHFDILPAGRAGFIGVDVFLVISGFLITAIIRDELSDNCFNLGVFYLKRIRRLAPSLLATLALVAIYGYYRLFPNNLISLSKELLSAQTYISNIYYWRTINYFGLASDSAYLLHTWSLAVEEQFYLVYPLVLIFINRFFRTFFWPILTTFMLLSFALNVAFISSKPEAVFYLLPTRAWELLLGAVTVGLTQKIHLRSSSREIAAVLGITGIVIGLFSYKKEYYFPGVFALLPTLGCALLIFSGAGYATLTGRILSNPVALFLGRISYPLYLVHWPIHVFARQFFLDAYSIGVRLAALVFSIALASALYHFVERPVRRRSIAGRDRLMLIAYGTGVACTVIVCLSILATFGFPQRYPAEVVRLASFAEDKTPPLIECQYRGQQLSEISDFCRIGAKSVQPTWLIYGDSHAWAAYPAFDIWLTASDQSALFIFRHSCLPLQGVNLFRDPQCSAFNANVISFLEKEQSIRSVLLVSTWRQAIEGITTAADVVPTRDGALKLFGEAFAETVGRLHRAGKMINIWEPVPGAKQNVPESLAEAAYTHREANIRIEKGEYQSTFDFFFTAINGSLPLIQKTVSPCKALCSSGKCAVTVNGNPAYFDNNHLTASSARFWADILSSSLETNRPIGN
jgi:peptidoglycan/LPS O-acetylase OafA/YrhL